jgi:hypothetical protein
MDEERKGKGDPPEGVRIHDLVDIVEEGTPGAVHREEVILREIRDVTERIARQMIPDIVERVIREEIEKLKKAGNG